MITDYASLMGALANKSKRPDLHNEIPDAIALAEDYFNSNLRTRQMEQRATATDAASLAVPDDFLELRNIRLNTDPATPLDYVTSQYADTFYGSATTGRPVVYTIYTNQFFFYPAPDSGYTVEVDYYQKITALSGTNTTNWLLTRYPRAYLYASLAELLAMEEQERAGLAAKLRDQICAQIQAESDDAQFSGAPVFIRPMVQIA